MALKKYVLITAGGTGTRMQSAVPKQFLLLKDKPILMHSMQAFYDVYQDLGFIVVLPEEYWDDWKVLCENHGFNLPHQLVEGGETRFQSVKNGLTALQEDGLVAIHDAVRPLVSKRVIQEGFELAGRQGNAIPCIPVNESVRTVQGDENKPADRDMLRIIQTPEVFKVSLIKKAYEVDYHPGYTDDASVLERMGERIQLFEGNIENIKITKHADLLIADALLESLNS